MAKDRSPSEKNLRKNKTKTKKRSLSRTGQWFRKRWIFSQTARSVSLGLIFIVVTTYFALPPSSPQVSSLKAGVVATKDYRAPSDILIKDEEATRRKMEMIAADVRPVYDIDIEASSRIRSHLDNFYERCRKITGQGKETPEVGQEKKAAGLPAAASLAERQSQIKDVFHEIFGDDLPKDIVGILMEDNFSDVGKINLSGVITTVLNKGVISNKSLLRKAEKGIVIRYLSLGREEVIENIQEIIDAEEGEKIMAGELAGLVDNKRLQKALTTMSSIVLQPNLTFNKSETEGRISSAKESASPVFIQVKAGEVVVREGEKISEEQYMKIRQIWPADLPARKINKIAGYLLLNILAMFLIWIFSSEYLINQQDFPLLFTLLLMVLIISRITFLMAEPINTSFPRLDIRSFFYGLPTTFAPWLAAMLVSMPAAFIMAVSSAFYANLILGGGVSYLVVFLASGFLAAYLGHYCHQRTVFFKTGMYIGLLNVVLISAQHLMKTEFFSIQDLKAVLFGFSSGPVSALIVSGVLPLIENFFGKTTDIRLLELSNPTNPLLKMMVVEAPGTYHHSILVGNLAEAAAEAIGANPLQARISSYFHDIGKIRKPEYFYENNIDNRSRHETLSPSMSSLILIAHVKDGLELAREYKLPQMVMDAIKEHHGTSLITYFFKKAKEKENASVQTSKESDFRYPGPKPQTKENAIIMLADQVEAACRALPEASPSKIKGVVNRIINNIFMDGQLNECDLTLKDLEIIKSQFTRILVGTYHQRLDYPEVVNGKLVEEKPVGHKKSAKERKPVTGSN